MTAPLDHPWRDDALELAFEGLAVLEGDRIVRLNEAFATKLQAQPAQLVGRSLAELLVREDLEFALADLAAGSPVVARARLAGGGVLTVQLRRKPLAGGQHLLSLRDASAADEALRQSEARYRALVEQARDIVLRFDRSGCFLYINAAVRHVIGLGPEDLIDRHYRELGFDEALFALWDANMDRLRSGEPAFATRFTLPTVSGPRDFEFWLMPERDGAGELKSVHALGRDITELRLMASTLRESERRLATLIGNVPGMVYRSHNDAQWTMSFVSEGCRELTGYAPADFIGNRRVSFDDLYHVEDRARIWAEVQAALSARRPFELTYRITDRDGCTKWIWEKGHGVFDEHGGLLFLEGLLMDITAQRELIERLAKREAQLRDAQQTARLGSWEWDLRTGELVWSDEFWRLLGLSPGAVEPSIEVFLSVVHPEDRSALGHRLTHLDHVPDAGPFEDAYRLLLPGGEVRHVLTRGEAFEEAAGRRSKLVGTMQDVTAWREAEQARRASEARYRLLAENASDLVALVAPDLTFTYLSPSCERITGYAPEELLGTPVTTHIHPDDLPRLKGAIARTSATSQSESVVYRYRHKSGRDIWLEASGNVIYADDGATIIGYQVSRRDVTEREQAQAELMAANAELTRLSQLKDRFLASVNHELRTPLAAIQSAAAILGKGKAGALNETQRRFTELIRCELKSLSRLVDDILEFQRLELGGDAMTLAPVELRELLGAVVAAERAGFAQRQLELAIELPEFPLVAPVDRPAIERVVRSLLSNAAKFTGPGGRVTVRAERVGPEVRLSVSDSGMGIPEADLERVFEKFVQLDGGMTRQFGGTGLGLALCRQIVEAGHGGRIWAESAPGAGTTVHMALPGARATHGDGA